MKGFVTDRSQKNVDRLNELSAKGWDNMTAAERAEWTGDPLTASLFGYDAPVNLVRDGVNYGPNVELTYKNGSITATATASGRNLAGVITIGPYLDFKDKRLTLSVESVETTGGAYADVSAYWYNSDGAEYAGGELIGSGVKSFKLNDNIVGRDYLALYLYVSGDTSVSAGASVKYNGLMLEFGTTKSEYVPYTPILPTPATKGAYNYADMNRVESAVKEIAESLGLTLTTKTTWSKYDIPTADIVERYLGNIESIRNAYSGSTTLPSIPTSMTEFTYDTANNIEKILEIVGRSI